MAQTSPYPRWHSHLAVMLDKPLRDRYITGTDNAQNIPVVSATDALPTTIVETDPDNLGWDLEG